MQKYTRRTVAPAKGNKWYTRIAYGGVNNNDVVPRHERWKGSACDNCGGYGPGRYFEAQAVNGALFGRTDPEEIRKFFAYRKKGKTPVEMWAAYNADSRWKPYCKQTPKRGAMAFYKRVNGKGYGGHMNVIEHVNADGTCSISNNNYETAPRFSYLKNKNPKTLYSGYFVLLGYVWPLADFEGETYKTTAALNCRKTPAGDIVGTFASGATVTLDGDHKDHGGHVWKHVKGKDRNGKNISGYVDMTYLK